MLTAAAAVLLTRPSFSTGLGVLLSPVASPPAEQVCLAVVPPGTLAAANWATVC